MAPRGKQGNRKRNRKGPQVWRVAPNAPLLKVPVYDVRLSMEQAASRLGISTKTVANMISRRQIGAFRGRPCLIPESEVHRILQERYRPPLKLWVGQK